MCGRGGHERIVYQEWGVGEIRAGEKELTQRTQRRLVRREEGWRTRPVFGRRHKNYIVRFGGPSVVFVHPS